MKKIIESTSNDYIKKLASLKNKKEIIKNELFLIEGDNLIKEAVKSGIVKTILVQSSSTYSEYKDIERIKVTSLIIEKLSSNKTNPGAIAVCIYAPKKIHFEDCKKLIVLDGINNPGNLGTIIRTASAFNFDGILLLNDSVFPYSDKVIKSSLGTIFEMPVIKLDDLTKLKKFNIYNFVLSKKSLPLSETTFKKPMALVFGNEAHGISRNTIENLKGENIFIEIEKNNIESLNLANAASIAMYLTRK